MKCAIFVATVAACSAMAADGPVVTVTPTKIVAAGTTPGGKVVFFGLGWEPKRSHAVAHRWAKVVADTAKNASAEYVFDQRVTWNALWVVADLTSGRYAVAMTTGYPLLQTRLVRHEFKRDAQGAVSRFIYSRPAADFLYVVPGGGAWKLILHDGDAVDAEGADGYVALDLSRAEPLVQGERPRAFTPGGTLIAVDSQRMEVLEIRITGQMLDGAK